MIQGYECNKINLVASVESNTAKIYSRSGCFQKNIDLVQQLYKLCLVYKVQKPQN